MTQTFTEADIHLLKSKIDRAYFSLARVYAPFLVALFLAYYFAQKKAIGKTISMQQYNRIFLIVFGFFFIVFCIFCYRDYAKKVLPYKREISAGSKTISTFSIRKYFDPVFRQFLLYHPTKENKYIVLTEKEFNSIEEGTLAELHTGQKTGITLAITINGKVMVEIEEFSFS